MMDDLINELNSEKIEKAIERGYDVHTINALIHIAPLCEFLKRDPDKAIEMIASTYNRALDDAYTDRKGENNRDFVEGVAGGPCETIPWQTYNAVGAVYPYLTRTQKDRALKQLISIWDEMNWGYVNGERGTGHTTGIREPLLLSDVEIVRPIYWPGLHD